MRIIAVLAIVASLVTFLACLGVIADLGHPAELTATGGAGIALLLSMLLTVGVFRRQTYSGSVLRNLPAGRESTLADAFEPAKREEVEELQSELERHKKLERELIAARQQAEAAMMAKGEFLATMSHEIRTPLNGIIPMLDLLLSTQMSVDQREYLQIAYTSSKQLLSIVDDILDFSKLEANKLELETVGINLKELLDGVTRLMEKSAEAKSLQFYTKIAPDVRLTVRGDPVRLRQILTNLVSNAIKFTDNGEVSVHLSRVGETRTRFTLRFEVRDTGIGISRANTAKLFQAFSQADASTTRTFGGTGLGLAICKRIVDLMGGKIGVDSTPGKGSTFWFEVPIDKALGDIQGVRPTDPNSTRLLLVTTNQNVGRRFAQIMPQWGVSFAHASNTQDALTKLRGVSLRAGQRGFTAILVDGGSIPSTLLALHRTLSRDPDVRDIPRIYLRAEEPLPAEIEQAPGFYVVNRESSDHELKNQVFRILDELSEPEDVPEPRPLFSQPEPEPEEQQEPAPTMVPPSPAMSQSAPPVVPQPVPAQAPAVGAAPAPAATSPVSGSHVLLVEDNPVNRQVAQRLLTLAGLTFDTAENGKEALDLLSSGVHYAAVLMDCQMPVMDGYSATRAWRERETTIGKPRLPIIAMTANAMIGDREKCLAAGMDDYLSKPLNRALLETTLQRWIEATSPRNPPVAAAPKLVAPPPVAAPAPAPVVAPRPVPPPVQAPVAPAPVAPRAPTLPPQPQPTQPPRPAPAPAPAPAPQESSTPAIDATVIEDLRDIMGSEFVSLVRVFLDDAPKAINKLTALANAGETATMAAPAHTLKSTSANLGAMALSAVARGIEQTARQNMLTNPVERVAQLDAEFRRAEIELRRFLR